MTQKHTRGSILLLSLFFMFLLFLLSVAFVTFIPVESRAALRTESQTTGSLVADAGVTEALQWLRFQIAPPDGSPSKEPLHPTVYLSPEERTRVVGGGWSYRWSLEPDSETYPNPANNPIRGYTVVSRAYLNGRVQRQAVAQVIQESLSRYAALYDEWPSNLVMPVRSDDVPTGGPVHINDVMRLWVSEGAGYWSSVGEEKFSHGLTASGSFESSDDGFAYYQGNWSGGDPNKIPYNDGGPIHERYNRMVDGGIENLNAGVSEVPLPDNTFEVRDAAWGFDSSNPLPSSAGVYVNTEGSNVAGGIFIEGDVEEMQLGVGGSQPAGPGSVDYEDNSWVKIELPLAGQDSIDTDEAVTVVTVSDTAVTLPTGAVVNGSPLGGPFSVPVGSTLLRRADGTFEHYAGELNGVIYSTGDIQNLWGTNKGRRTVTSEFDQDTGVEKDIIIGGAEDDATGILSVEAGSKGLIQYDAQDSDGDEVYEPPATADHVLGLIGYNVQVSAGLKQGSWADSHPEDNPLFLFAIVLAGIPGEGGTYSVQDYDSGGAGWTYRYGSRIIAEGGAWGTTSGHGLIEGNTFFDEAAAVAPPPYFPSVPTFVVKSYEDLPDHSGDLL